MTYQHNAGRANAAGGDGPRPSRPRIHGGGDAKFPQSIGAIHQERMLTEAFRAHGIGPKGMRRFLSLMYGQPHPRRISRRDAAEVIQRLNDLGTES